MQFRKNTELQTPVPLEKESPEGTNTTLSLPDRNQRADNQVLSGQPRLVEDIREKCRDPVPKGKEEWIVYTLAFYTF